MRKVIITIAPDGTPTIDVQGVQGTSCKDLTRSIELAYGEVSEEQLKPEFYGQEVSHASNQDLA